MQPHRGAASIAVVCIQMRKERDMCIWTHGGLVCEVKKGEIRIWEKVNKRRMIIEGEG